MHPRLYSTQVISHPLSHLSLDFQSEFISLDSPSTHLQPLTSPLSTMSMKRKLSLDFDDAVEYSMAKRPNRIPFPNSEMDTDVAMSDSSSDAGLLTPLSIPDHPFHTRLHSNASTVSEGSSLENSPASSPYYPNFVLYPAVDQDLPMDTPNYFNSSADISPKPVGLIQPKGSMFTHHGNCSQIPKLRMSCASGLNGQRTMWSHCEQCGSIEMVNFD